MPDFINQLKEITQGKMQDYSQKKRDELNQKFNHLYN